MDIKSALLGERDELMKSIDLRKASLKGLKTSSPDAGDSGQQIEEQDQLHREINQLASRVKSINTAIGRIDAGDFGWCEDCGDKIPLARLKSKPDALRCVDCQHEFEVRSMHYRGAA